MVGRRPKPQTRTITIAGYGARRRHGMELFPLQLIL
jgi:hypothetical protein